MKARQAGTIAAATIAVLMVGAVALGGSLAGGHVLQREAQARPVKERQEGGTLMNVVAPAAASAVYVEYVGISKDAINGNGSFGPGAYMQIIPITDSPYVRLQEIRLEGQAFAAYRIASFTNVPIANPYYEAGVDPASHQTITAGEDTPDCYLLFYVITNDLVVTTEGSVINADDLSGLECAIWSQQ